MTKRTQLETKSLSPVNEKPLETEELLIPPHDLLGCLPGTCISDVIKVCDWTRHVLLFQAAGLSNRIKPGQEAPLILSPVNQRVTHIPHYRLDHRVGDMTALVPHGRGRHQETAAPVAKSVEWPFHVLHLETHVARSVHRGMWADVVQTSRGVVLAVFPYGGPVWIGWVSVFIQSPSALVRSLVHDEYRGSFPQSQLPGLVGQSGSE